MGRRRPKQKPRPEYDSSAWQFQLMPISEMDIDELIAMDAYYANQSPLDGQSPLEWALGDTEVDDEDVSGWDDDRSPPTASEIAEDNSRLLRRQREFRLAAEYIARALAELPAVRKVALFGSVAVPLQKEAPRFRQYAGSGTALWHECKDLDLAVWVDPLDGLKALQKARTAALNTLLRERGVGVAHHQAELFIMEPASDRYLGRLCCYGTCPKGKRECRTPGCGAHPFLQQHKGFALDAGALSPERSTVLFERSLP